MDGKPAHTLLVNGFVRSMVKSSLLGLPIAVAVFSALKKRIYPESESLCPVSVNEGNWKPVPEFGWHHESIVPKSNVMIAGEDRLFLFPNLSSQNNREENLRNAVSDFI